MPSQRLLKMLDPHGGYGPGVSLLTSPRPKAIVWAPESLRNWIATEARGAGVDPLHAASLRHLGTSLRAERPRFAYAIIVLEPPQPDVITTLISARWSGYTGNLILVADPARISTEMRSRLDVAAVVPRDPLGPLSAYLSPN